MADTFQPDRILEKNSTDNTNIDGACFNHFSTGQIDLITKGRLNECALTFTSNTVAMNTGEIIASGFRNEFDNAITFSFTTFPVETETYSIILEIDVDDNNAPTTNIYLILKSSLDLIQDNIFENGSGTYMVEVAYFDLTSNGILEAPTKLIKTLGGVVYDKLEIGETSDTAYAGDKGAANAANISALDTRVAQNESDIGNNYTRATSNQSKMSDIIRGDQVVGEATTATLDSNGDNIHDNAVSFQNDINSLRGIARSYGSVDYTADNVTDAILNAHVLAIKGASAGNGDLVYDLDNHEWEYNSTAWVDNGEWKTTSIATNTQLGVVMASDDMSVNATTGAVTINHSTNADNADLLESHTASYFAMTSDTDALDTRVTQNEGDIETNATNIDVTNDIINNDYDISTVSDSFIVRTTGGELDVVDNYDVKIRQIGGNSKLVEGSIINAKPTKIISTGKNLLNLADENKYALESTIVYDDVNKTIAMTATGSNPYMVVGTFSLPVGDYSFSTESDVNLANMYVQYQDGTIIASVATQIAGYITCSFTLTEEKTIILRLDGQNDGLGGTQIFSDIMLNIGLTALDYEIYSGDTFPIATEIQSESGYGMGLDTTGISGLTRTDLEYKNYPDYENKTFVKNLKSILVDGVNYKCNYLADGSNGMFVLYDTSNSKFLNDAEYYTYWFSIKPILTDSGLPIGKSLYNLQEENESGVIVGTDSHIIIKLDDATSETSTWTVATINAYLVANPFTIIYPLKTPVVTDKTEYMSSNTYKAYSGGIERFDDVSVPTYLSADYVNITESEEVSNVGLYYNFGVIGDSYASGEVYDESENQYDNYWLSWGQQLARSHGNTCYNFSRGGLDTTTWLTSYKGLDLLNSTQALNLYILVLGINDYGHFGDSYIGTADDINLTDSSLNADSFYGNYGKIISAIQEKAPDAKIIISSIPLRIDDAFDNYNTAIEGIATKFGIPHINVEDDWFFTSSAYASKVLNHPTADDYAGYAMAMDRLYAKCTLEYNDYFKNYVGAGNDYQKNNLLNQDTECVSVDFADVVAGTDDYFDYDTGTFILKPKSNVDFSNKHFTFDNTEPSQNYTIYVEPNGTQPVNVTINHSTTFTTYNYTIYVRDYSKNNRLRILESGGSLLRYETGALSTTEKFRVSANINSDAPIHSIIL